MRSSQRGVCRGKGGDTSEIRQDTFEAAAC